MALPLSLARFVQIAYDHYYNNYNNCKTVNVVLSFPYDRIFMHAKRYRQCVMRD